MKRLKFIISNSVKKTTTFKNIVFDFFNSIKKYISNPKQALLDVEDKIFKNFMLHSYRTHLFTYLSQGLRNGGVTKRLLESMLSEYKEMSVNKRFGRTITLGEYCNLQMHNIVLESIRNISINGDSDAEAMYKAGLINSKEFTAVQNISAAEPYKAIEFINDRARDQNNLKFALLMLFFPSIIVLTGYFIFQPELKAMTLSMLEPVNSVSTKQIPVPGYIENRYTFGFFLGLAILSMVTFFSFINYLKKNNPKLLFKLFRMTEREFIINNFELMVGLMKSGQSPIQAISAIRNGADDEATKRIFSEIEYGFLNGEQKMFEVFKKYEMDISTVSYIRGGEAQNYLEPAVIMALEYNKVVYAKTTARLTKILPLIGEIIMSIILLKPLLDVLMVTTSGSLNFSV